MKESIKKYFDVGLVTWMAYPSIINESREQVIRIIKKIITDDYFDAIELTSVYDDELLDKIKKLINTSKIRICYGVAPRLLRDNLNPNDIDEKKRLEVERVLKEEIDIAYKIGAKAVSFLSGNWTEDTKDLCYKQLFKTTCNICEYAKEKEMRIDLEVFDYDVAKKTLIGPSSYAAKFAAEIRSVYSNFGLLIDMAHISLLNETYEYSIEVLRPYITHIHISNAVIIPKEVGYGDEHQRFGFPNGRNDVQELLQFLKTLKKEGFFNGENSYVLSFEVKPWEDEDSDAVVVNAKRTLNKAWALLGE